MLGLDSLVAIEIKNWIESSTGVLLPLAHLLKGPSISELAAIVQEELSNAAAPELQRVERAIRTVEQLSDQEVRAMLQQVQADELQG